MPNKKESSAFLTISVGLLVLAGGLCSGCANIGNAPAGASAAETKALFDQKPLDQRAKMIMGFPGRLEEKQQKVKDMYAKEGKVAPPEVLQVPAAPGPGASAPATGQNPSPVPTGH